MKEKIVIELEVDKSNQELVSKFLQSHQQNSILPIKLSFYRTVGGPKTTGFFITVSGDSAYINNWTKVFTQMMDTIK